MYCASVDKNKKDFDKPISNCLLNKKIRNLVMILKHAMEKVTVTKL